MPGTNIENLPKIHHNILFFFKLYLFLGLTGAKDRSIAMLPNISPFLDEISVALMFRDTDCYFLPFLHGLMLF